MSDIVDRLRDRAYSLKAKDRLCEEAAQVIQDLRSALKSALDQRDLLLVKVSQWESTPPQPYAESITKDGISNTDGRIWLSTQHPPD